MQFTPRDRLAFPAGTAPGFDPAHVAASSVLLSAVSYGTSNLINILTGKPGIPVDQGGGPPTQRIDQAGPGIDVSNSSATTFPGFYTSPPPWMTIGVILTTPDVSVLGNPGVFHPVFSNASPSTGQEFCLALFQPNGPAWNSWGGSSGANTNIPIPVDTPIFVASSYNISTGEMLAVLRNLRTGQTFFEQTTGNVGTYLSPTDGVLFIGSYNRNSGKNIAAVMHSTAKVSRAQMLLWAEDPWAFWYPRAEPETFVGGSLANLVSQTVSVACAAMVSAARSTSKAATIAGTATVTAAKTATERVSIACATSTTVSAIQVFLRTISATCGSSVTQARSIGKRAVVACSGSVALAKTIAARISVVSLIDTAVSALTGAAAYAVDLSIACTSAVVGSASSIFRSLWTVAIKSRENWTRE